MRALFVALLFVLPAPFTSAQSDACPPEAPRLTAGEEGRVLGGVTLNVRREPRRGDNRVGQMPPYAMFSVLEGPVCAEGYRWWRVRWHHVERDVTGWIAEGSPHSEAWVEARGRRVMLNGRWHVVGEDGAPEPEGCLTPPDDYTRVRDGWAVLNARTRAMLDHAQRLYEAQAGRRYARFVITQGSYNPGVVAASFGTHDGGGAVDLSVRSPVDFSLPRDQIEPLVYALRVAGFAAWLRDTGDLYPASPIHIHAVAIGDREASEAARAQIDGTFGYLRGFDGIPRPDGIPQMDRHGGPVICQWMRELGFDDLRNLPYPTATPGGTANPIASGGSQ